MTDLISNGRMDLGIGSGAYQREFDRRALALIKKMAINICKKCCHWFRNYGKAMWRMMGNIGSSRLTSCPKPVQENAYLVAARSPINLIMRLNKIAIS